MPEQGYEIYNRFYPEPKQYRMGDPVLVREVTGMEWPEFVEALAAQDEEVQALSADDRLDEFTPDQIVMLGLMTVCFAHGNQQMSRQKVVRAVLRIPIEDVKFIPGDEEDDAGPPDEAPGDLSSESSSGSDASAEEPETTEIPADST